MRLFRLLLVGVLTGAALPAQEAARSEPIEIGRAHV